MIAAEPIRVECEGSGCPAHPLTLTQLAICSMCGAVVATTGGAEPRAVQHERDDVLAMLDRGDFG